jgi:hypothetical protein
MAAQNGRKRVPKGPAVRSGSGDAKRAGAIILEVLAGSLTPSGAAKAMGVSPARYYVLEARALGGLVDACEARPKGRVRSPQQEIAVLTRENERLKSECARSKALARAAHRAMGISVPVPEAEGPLVKGKRRRRPVVRALRAVDRLRSESGDKEAAES